MRESWMCRFRCMLLWLLLAVEGSTWRSLADEGVTSSSLFGHNRFLHLHGDGHIRDAAAARPDGLTEQLGSVIGTHSSGQRGTLEANPDSSALSMQAGSDGSCGGGEIAPSMDSHAQSSMGTRAQPSMGSHAAYDHSLGHIEADLVALARTLASGPSAYFALWRMGLRRLRIGDDDYVPLVPPAATAVPAASSSAVASDRAPGGLSYLRQWYRHRDPLQTYEAVAAAFYLALEMFQGEEGGGSGKKRGRSPVQQQASAGGVNLDAPAGDELLPAVLQNGSDGGGRGKGDGLLPPPPIMASLNRSTCSTRGCGGLKIAKQCASCPGQDESVGAEHGEASNWSRCLDDPCMRSDDGCNDLDDDVRGIDAAETPSAGLTASLSSFPLEPTLPCRVLPEVGPPPRGAQVTSGAPHASEAGVGDSNGPVDHRCLDDRPTLWRSLVPSETCSATAVHADATRAAATIPMDSPDTTALACTVSANPTTTGNLQVHKTRPSLLNRAWSAYMYFEYLDWQRRMDVRQSFDELWDRVERRRQRKRQRQRSLAVAAVVAGMAPPSVGEDMSGDGLPGARLRMPAATAAAESAVMACNEDTQEMVSGVGGAEVCLQGAGGGLTLEEPVAKDKGSAHIISAVGDYDSRGGPLGAERGAGPLAGAETDGGGSNSAAADARGTAIAAEKPKLTLPSMQRWGSRSPVAALFLKAELMWLDGRPYLTAVLLVGAPVMVGVVLWAVLCSLEWLLLLATVPGGRQRRQLWRWCVLEVVEAFEEGVETARRRLASAGAAARALGACGYAAMRAVAAGWRLIWSCLSDAVCWPLFALGVFGDDLS